MKRVRRVNLKELFVASLVVTSEDCFGGNCQFVEIARKLQHTKNFSIRKLSIRIFSILKELEI